MSSLNFLMEMNDDNTERVEEYYNCGYDGIYEPQEKAVMFECVGRGLKLPPLSQIYFPTYISKDCSKHTLNVRPSHHMLNLLGPPMTLEESNLHGEHADKPQSSQSNECSEIHSESSDLDVYMSEEDDVVDECDSHPTKLVYHPVQNNIEKHFLPPNLPCGVVCSSSGNRLALNETDTGKNEKDDSSTSDGEIFSDPSFADGSESDSEDVSVATNNLNQTIPCTINKNSANNVNNAGGQKNIYLEEDASVTNTGSLGVSDSCRSSSITKHQILPSSDDSNPSETVCVEGKRDSAFDEEHENSSVSSNGSKNLICEMFSDEDTSDFYVSHFQTLNRSANTDLPVDNPPEFSQLSAKQIQKPQKKCKVERLPSNQLSIKNIANLLLPNPVDAGTCEKGINVETSKKDAKTQNHGVLVLKNLPSECREDVLVDFIQDIANTKIRSIKLERYYDKVTAKIMLNANTEFVDWLIECLNGSSSLYGVEAEALECHKE